MQQGNPNTKVYNYILGMSEEKLLNTISLEYEHIKGECKYSPAMREESYKFAGTLLIWRYCREKARHNLIACGNLMVILGEVIGYAYVSMPNDEWNERIDSLKHNSTLLDYYEWGMIYTHLKYTIADKIKQFEFYAGDVLHKDRCDIYTEFRKQVKEYEGYRGIKGFYDSYCNSYDYFTTLGLYMRQDVPLKYICNMSDVDKMRDDLSKEMGGTELFNQRDVQKIQELINLGFAINITDYQGDTPLTTCGSFEGLKVLIENGADVNYSPSKKPFSKWHLKSDIVHYLFEQGAMFNPYRDAYEPEVCRDLKFPFDEYSCRYIESEDKYRMKMALIFFSNASARRISYEEACARVNGGASELSMLIMQAHKIYLEKNEVEPFLVRNGKIFAYVLL